MGKYVSKFNQNACEHVKAIRQEYTQNILYSQRICNYNLIVFSYNNLFCVDMRLHIALSGQFRLK